MDIIKYFRATATALAFVALLAACTPKNITTDQPAAEGEVFGPQTAEEKLDPELQADPESDTSTLTEAEKTVLRAKFGLLFDLEPHETKEVEQYFKYFTHKARGTFERWLKRSEPYLPYVRKTLTRHGLPQDMVLLPFTESGYNAKAYSWAGAGGMWQFMPYTGRKYGLRVDWWIDERRDPYKATEAAAMLLKELHAEFGDWYLALAAYNAGPGKISRALKGTNTDNFFDLCDKNNRLSRRARLKKETRHYVPKFIAISKIFQNLEALGFEPVRWDQEQEIIKVDVPGGTDLLALSRAGNMNWKDFHTLNPAYRRQVSPPGMTTTAYLPVENADKMIAYLADPSSRPYAGYIRHQVRSGDSWWRIARKYGVPVAVLKKVNNTSSNTLRPGQHVMVPGRGSSKTLAASAGPAEPIPTSGKYKVRRGDSWWTISQKFGTTIAKLKHVNGQYSNTLRVGQVVAIPGAAKTVQAAATDPRKTRAIAQQRSNYVVKNGDSLWSISQKFRTSVNTIRTANGLSSNAIKPGMKLYIPSNTGAATRTAAKQAEQTKEQLVRYKVRRGDTLSKIAKRFSVSISDLRRWNSLNSKGTIYAGQSLKVYVR